MPSRRDIDRLSRLLDKTSSDQPATTRELALALRRACPQSVQAEGELAGALVELKLFRRARTAIAKLSARGRKPRAAAAYFNGRLHRALGELDSAERCFRKAATGGGPGLVQLGATLARRERFTDARRAYREALRAGIDDASEAYLNIGLTYRCQRRYLQALNAFEKALSLDPHYAEARKHRADIRRALKVAPPADQKRHWRLILSEWARMSTARELAHDYCRRYPKNAVGWFAAASLLHEFGCFREGMRALTRAWELTDRGTQRIGRAAFYQELGDRNVRRLDFTRAESWFRRAVRVRATVRPLEKLGRVLIARGRFVSAERYLRHATDLGSGKDDMTHYALGLIARARRDYPKALDQLNRALRLAPANELAAVVRRDVRSALAIRKRYS
jgi:tetratricopeptide (TPR) repeat protein